MDADELPSGSQLHLAAELYLRHAYPEGKVPASVQDRLTRLNAAGDAPFSSDVFETSPVPGGTRYALRLGNIAYPHMKLVVEPAPAGRVSLFRVDTHDRHIRPAPGSRDYDAFMALQQRNAQIAADIEAAFTDAGLLTFKEYLRRDLLNRAAGAASSTPSRESV